MILLCSMYFICNRFNTAEIGAMSRDIPYEANVLVKRMTSDLNVNIREHWKVIIVFFSNINDSN